MTIFWHPTGPLVRYEDGALHIADLNPELKTQWRMGRMVKFGWRCILAAIKS